MQSEEPSWSACNEPPFRFSDFRGAYCEALRFESISIRLRTRKGLLRIWKRQKENEKNVKENHCLCGAVLDALHVAFGVRTGRRARPRRSGDANDVTSARESPVSCAYRRG